MTMERTELTAKIEEKYKKMSKGHKRIADYIRQNYDKAAFMTANKLGGKVGVSESTVVRFADSLGYDGYPQLQRAMQDVIRNRLTTVQLIEMTGELKEDEVLAKVLKGDVDNIRATLSEIDPAVFDSVVSTILGADKVYVMGVRSAAPLSQFIGYYLDFMMRNVRTVASGIGDVFERMIHITEKDVFIGISFPRYSNRTIECMRFASSKGAKCIAITDSEVSPLCEHSDLTLCAKSNMTSFVDSLVAPFSVVNALIVAIGMKKREQISANFEELEKIWIEHNVYASGK